MTAPRVDGAPDMADRNTDPSPKPVQRRGFFTALGLGAAASVAAATTAAVMAPEPAEAMTPPGDKGGPHYRESEHIKQYYRVNRY